MALLAAVSIATTFFYYIIYITIIGVIALAFRHPYTSANKAIDQFFKYTKKGHKKVVMPGDFMLFFFVMQLPYLILVFAVPFWIYIPVTIALAYCFAWLKSDRVKEQDTELVFVTNSKKTKEEIERITGNKYKALKLPANQTGL